MEPFVLQTDRLILDQPTEADIDDVAAYCAEPVFERFMVTPWPYERQHAEFFVREYIPGGWERDEEWTWALREQAGGPLLGVVGVRVRRGDVGYWLGGPFRGHGFMPEAVTGVVDTVFERTGLDAVLWECTVGNLASLAVARKAGFAYDGRRPGLIPDRDGSPIDAWHGVLRRDDDREPKPGWPV